jgi:hypothetical protein
MLLNFTLEHTIRNVQENEGGLQLNGSRPLLLYADV